MKARPVLILLLALATPAVAADWPQWRHDAGRAAVSPEELPARLSFQWSRELGAPRPAWADDPAMRVVDFDATYEPVVMGSTLFVGSSRNDALMAFDTETGAERWCFYADGPIRFAPIAVRDKVYVASDDGRLYALDAATGRRLWTFQAAPGPGRVIGNGRAISSWPIRGGPVLADGVIYLAAGMWPFQGIRLYAVDAETGKAVWANPALGDVIFVQAKGSLVTPGGVPPQGYLAVAGDLLLVPCGRSRPACFDRRTGRLRYFNPGRRAGRAFVATVHNYWFNKTSAFDAITGEPSFDLGVPLGPLVLTSEAAYVAAEGTIRRFELAGLKANASRSPDDHRMARLSWVPEGHGTPMEWSSLGSADAVWLAAGSRVFAGRKGGIVAFDMAGGRERWSAELAGAVGSMIAGDGKLFVVTTGGVLYCFGERGGAVRHGPKGAAGPRVRSGPGGAPGYAVVAGAEDAALLADLALGSRLHVVALERDAARVNAARRALDKAGLYGTRVAVIHDDPLSAAYPPYTARLVVVGESEARRLAGSPAALRHLFHLVRPYGGRMVLPSSVDTAWALAELRKDARFASVRAEAQGADTALVRAGGPPGSGRWTHEDADPGRTRNSRDALVRPPFAVLWFGGRGADFKRYPNHHVRPPRPQIAGGRLIQAGCDAIHAQDIYTGLVLWKAEVPGYNPTDVRNPAGSRISGGHFVTLEDSVYVNVGTEVWRLDGATGELVGTFPLGGERAEAHGISWGFAAVEGDVLVAGAEMRPSDLSEKGKSTPAAAASSKRLVAMDRRTGRELWSIRARHRFRHNAVVIGNGRLFCVDQPGPTPAERFSADMLGEVEGALQAIDIRTGKRIWAVTANVFANMLLYSADEDVLVQTLDPGPRNVQWFRRGGYVAAHNGATGEVIWQSEIASMNAPLVLAGPRLLCGMPSLRGLAFEFDLRTGRMTRWPDMTRGIGRVCSGWVACDNILTLRSNYAAYVDLNAEPRIEVLGGFRSGCTENLIAAGGILSAPAEFSSHCSCNYQIQTSLALVHDPDARAARRAAD